MKIAKSVNRLGTEAVYNIFAKTKASKVIYPRKLSQIFKIIIRAGLINENGFI